jgi:hypothetical protein
MRAAVKSLSFSAFRFKACPGNRPLKMTPPPVEMMRFAGFPQSLVSHVIDFGAAPIE